MPALLGLSPHFLPALAACQRASVAGQPLPRAQLCPLCLLGSAGEKSPPRCWVCQAGDKRPASPSGARFWVGRRARTPGAEIWAQPAPPPQHHRGWLTAPSSFQWGQEEEAAANPSIFPLFPQLCPKGADPARFPVCSVAAAGLAAAPRSRPRVQQAGASAALPLRAARPGLFPGGISSRRARGLLCVLAWPRGSGKDERPSLASSSCQHSALGWCCKAHAKPKGLRGVLEWC